MQDKWKPKQTNKKLEKATLRGGSRVDRTGRKRANQRLGTCQGINPKGSQPWIFNGRTVAETEAAIIWPPDVKSQFIGKDPNAGKDWRQKEKWEAEDG